MRSARWIRLIPYAGALALALAANRFFTGEWVTRFNNGGREAWSLDQTIGLLCLLAGLVLAVRCFGENDSYPAGSEPAGEAASPGWKSFLPATVFFLFSNTLYLALGESQAVRWLWVASVAALIPPALGGGRWKMPNPLPFWEFILLFLILVAAFTLRFVDLTQVPYHVDNDVSIMGVLSKGLVERGDHTWVGMAASNHQYSEHQILAWGMRLFGLNHYGLVMLSVLAGTATCAVTYFLGKALFNRWVGFLAAGFLTFDYVHLHFSRIVFGPVTTFFVSLGLLFLAHGLKGGRRLPFLGAGICLGGGLLAYYSGRVGPLFATLAIVFWWRNRSRLTAVTWSHWILLAGGLLCTFGPNLAYALTESGKLHGRGHTVIIWSDSAWSHLSQKYQSGGSALTVLLEQVQRTFLAPFFYPDESTICYLSKPMLGGLAAVFFVMGLGHLLGRWRSFESLQVLSWIGLVFFLGGVMTIDPPFWPHLNIATPALALVAGVGAERSGRRLILAGGGWALKLVPWALVSALLFVGIHQWEVYHRFASKHAGGRIHMVRLMEKLPPYHRVFLVSPGVRWEHEAFQFFTPHVDGANLSYEDLKRNPPAITKPTSFFVFEDADKTVPDFLMQHYPSATKKLYFDGWNWPVFHLIEVFPPGHVEQPQRFRRETDIPWNQPGWGYVAGVLSLMLAAGWWSLAGELRKRRGHA